MNVNLKIKLRIIRMNAILFAALFGLIALNKEFFRPRFNNSDLLNILTGCFPNFIAAYIISMAAVTAVLIRKVTYGRRIIYSSSILVSLILIIEELKPMWGASEYYDPYDIMASLVGSLFALMTFEFVSRLENRRK